MYACIQQTVDHAAASLTSLRYQDVILAYPWCCGLKILQHDINVLHLDIATLLSLRPADSTQAGCQVGLLIDDHLCLPHPRDARYYPYGVGLFVSSAAQHRVRQTYRTVRWYATLSNSQDPKRSYLGMDWNHLGDANGDGDDGAFEPDECTSDADSDCSDAETRNFDLDEDDLNLVSQGVVGQSAWIWVPPHDVS